MDKKSIIILMLLGLLLITAQTYSKEAFSISGTIKTSYDGDIHIGVFAMKDWQNINDKFPSPPYFQIIKITADQAKSGKIPFKFEGIKEGNYCIVAHQDKNKNGEIDRLVGGKLAEPRGLYIEPIAWPSWGEMNFKLDQDITGIEIAISDMIYQNRT